jgi:hypothetical protein
MIHRRKYKATLLLDGQDAHKLRRTWRKVTQTIYNEESHQYYKNYKACGLNWTNN